MVRFTAAGLSGLFIFSQLAYSLHLPFGSSHEKVRQPQDTTAKPGANDVASAKAQDRAIPLGPATTRIRMTTHTLCKQIDQ